MHAYRLFVLPLLTGLIAFSAAAASPESPLWRPVADEVYLQEINGKVETSAPVTALARLDGVLYAVSDGRVHTLEGERLLPVDGAPQGLNRLVELNGALWGANDSATFRYANGMLDEVHGEPMVDFTLHQGAVHGATREEVYRFEQGRFVNIKPEEGYLSSNLTFQMEDGTQVLRHPVRLGPIERIASYSETLYIMRPNGLGLLEGPLYETATLDWGEIPSSPLRDMKVLGSRLFVASDRGVGQLRGMAMTTIDGQSGLPYEDVTCFAIGFDRDLWIGTTRGAIRMTDDGQFHYFGAYHWLPGDEVHAITVSEDTVYIATEAGLGIIRYEPFTLLKKADYFERALDAGGFRRLGFVHKLDWNAGENAWLREISDNDGGRTSHYLAAMSYKYAVTGDEQARENAIDTFKAMAWLQQITGTDGFFARAIWSPEDGTERATGGSGGLPAKWYPTEDGLWYWKGDTSSDEVNAHYYAVSLFHDLVAEGAVQERAVEHLSRITRHIIDNGWLLRDVDGEPTRWGRWDPEYLLRPYGYYARGLNGMEAQMYAWVAYKITGDEFFKEGLDQLIDWRYHTYSVRTKLTFPPSYMVPWDDELAFRTYHPILRYADDPYLRGIYMRALERHWEVMRMQKIPHFNFMYGALTGNDCEEEEAVQHLREWSLDLVGHSFTNSHRRDLGEPEPGYTPYARGTRAVSPREQEAMWGHRASVRLDGGSGGRNVTPPIGWLEDYWKGRYYGIIEAPETDDPALIQAPDHLEPQRFADEFDGPPRPDDIVQD